MQLLNRIIGFTALFVAGCGEPASQTVKTQSGPVQGVTNEGVAIFRGIPYATPPFNYGMLDQIAALQWVQANIEKFGGDANNVTIFGESAGGHSVGQLMASPLARGLFHKAIAQSGTGFQQFQTTDQNNETISGFNAGRSVAAMVDVSGSDEITQLRAMSVEALAEAATDLEISSTFHPQVDGYVLPKPTSQIFALGEQAPVPLMLGSNADEGSVLYYMGLTPVDGSTITGPETVKQWDNLLLNEFGDQANALSIHYAIDGDSDVVKDAEQLMGDSWFGRHAYFMAQRHNTAGHPTFMYFFERRSASPDETIGATHAFEIFPVFGSTLPLWPTDERDEILSNEMQSYWSNFAKAGDPNNDRAPAWQSFSLLQPTEMALRHEKSYSRPVARMDRYEAMNGQLLRREKRALELSE